MSNSQPPTECPTPAPAEGKDQSLPPLSDRDFKTYNRLAEKMDYFHEHFRNMWKTLHTACVSNTRPPGMSLRDFINEGLMLCQYLSAHHSIEETYFFPLLARKMPEFRKHPPAATAAATKEGKEGESEADAKAAHLLKQHERIHEGMDIFEAYLKGCRSGETELDLRVMKQKMDTWGDVLFQHLDDEVRCLGAENMRKYWNLQEVRSFPI